MVVTDIRRIDDKRFCLYIDYEPYAPVYSSDIRRLKLRVGEPVEDEMITQFRRDYLYKRAMNKAVNSISFSDKCEQDIRRKLEALYYDADIVEATVDKLKSYGYIDDYRYACSYIRCHIGRKSARIIRSELMSKGILPHDIDRALTEAELPDERSLITSILTRRYTVSELSDKRDKAKMYMYRKGYDYRLVDICIDEITGSL